VAVRNSLEKGWVYAVHSAYPMNTIDKLSRSVCTAKTPLLGRKQIWIRHSDLLPPVCTVLSVDSKLVREARSSRDGTLRNTSRSVHPRSAVLVEAVPVDGCTETHVVLNVDDDSVAVVGLNRWSRVLSWIGDEY
jgi:hypothetical protein